MGEGRAGRLKLSTRARGDLAMRLGRLGLAIGNALNLMPVRRVMVAGWPAEFGDEAHAGILGGIEGSLFGGASAVNITFSNAELGREPAAGIALATYAYLHRGAMQPEALAGEITTDNLTE